MSNPTVYIFIFSSKTVVTRLPYAKWIRIRSGSERSVDFAGKAIRIAYAYILLKNRKPSYCPRIEGGIYYFDHDGRIKNYLVYFDLLEDMNEEQTGIINLQHRKKLKEYTNKYCWNLNVTQVQQVISCIWK